MLAVPKFLLNQGIQLGFLVRVWESLMVSRTVYNLLIGASQGLKLVVLWILEICIRLNSFGNEVDSVYSVIYRLPHLGCELVIRFHLLLVIFSFDLLQTLIWLLFRLFSVAIRVNVLNPMAFKDESTLLVPIGAMKFRLRALKLAILFFEHRTQSL